MGKAAERAFSNRNLACADAAFDVAGAAVAWPDQAVRLREAFARESGEWIDDERWLLLRLVSLWALGRDGEASPDAVRRASARALQECFAAVYLADVPRRREGPLCALDLDTVPARSRGDDALDIAVPDAYRRPSRPKRMRSGR